MNKLIITVVIFLISCASDNDPYPPYIQGNIPDAYTCEEVACGSYSKLMKCDDGTSAGELSCLFVEGFGCKWIGSNCKDAGVKD